MIAVHNRREDCRMIPITGWKLETDVGINIKNEETHRLIRELAKLAGETMTAAVTASVRERLVASAKGKK